VFDGEPQSVLHQTETIIDLIEKWSLLDTMIQIWMPTVLYPVLLKCHLTTMIIQSPLLFPSITSGSSLR
jgi:hypothetical protein